MFRFQDFYFEEPDKGEEEHILNWYIQQQTHQKMFPNKSFKKCFL